MSRRSKAIISAVCVFFLLINLSLFISQNELASQRLNGFTDEGRAGNQTSPETPFVGIRSISPSQVSTAGGDLINIATENISFVENQDIIIFHDGDSTLENVGVNIPYSQRGGDGIEGDWTFLDEHLANLSISWNGMPLQFNHIPFTNTMIVMPFLVPGYTTITATLVNGSGGPTENLSVETDSGATLYIQDVVPDLEIWFGNIRAEIVSHIGGGMLEVISPPMPYGNHSVAVVLPDGSVHWVIDELRHINYHTYTGADVTWTVPDGVDEVTFKLWGAGGGSGGVHPTNSEGIGFNGGAGGYSEGTLSVTQGQQLIIVAGQGGDDASSSYQIGEYHSLYAYGGGGTGGTNIGYSDHNTGEHQQGGGGGLSGVFIDSVSQNNSLLIAGGGGGGGSGMHIYISNGTGGPGGGHEGLMGMGPTGGGGGGNQTTGGEPQQYVGEAHATGGSALQGGNGGAGGGGGGGYFGGAGGNWGGFWIHPGGGGGSGYFNNTSISDSILLPGNGTVPPQQNNRDYVIGSGNGALVGNNGGHGLIVIITGDEDSILFEGIDNDGSTSEPEQIIGIKDVSPEIASTQGGDTIQIELENISFPETQQITIFNSGNTTVENAIINLPTAPIGLEGKVGCWSTGYHFNGLSFEIDGQDLSFNLTTGSANILIPELLPGNNSIVATFNSELPIPTNDDLSSGQPIAANFTIEYPETNIGIWFGNSKATESRHLGDLVIETVSPPMPYGNHSVAVVLRDGTVHWVIDELRHINYYTYTGADVNWTVPDGVDEVTFKLWGAGGGSTASSNGSGGAGGYSEGTFSTNSSDILKLVVGAGGAAGTANGAGAAGYGGGGAGGPRDSRHGGAGGGYSGIFLDNVTQADALLISGGGGGAGFQYGPTPPGDGGHGGGLIGGDAPNVGNYPNNWGGYGATGGTQDAGGAIGKAWLHGGSDTSFRTATAGSALQGGNGGDRFDDVGAGGGGGGGYFGGGGGAGAQPGIGGGGGSGYFNNTSISDSILLPGNGTVPPQQNNSDYVIGSGIGASIGVDGGHGLIVIITENETSILYDGLSEETPTDEGEDEVSNEETIEAEEVPEFFEEPLEAITYFITEHPAEAVVVTGSTGGLGVYLIGFRRQRNELKEALSAAGAWRTTGGAHLISSFKALGILRKARAAAFTLGPLSWAWDEMLFEAMSKKLAEYGISDVMTLEGLISWLIFDVLGLTITSPVTFKEEFFPMIRMISTVLFIFFIYWIFFKRESLLEKARDMGTAEVEERKERLEQPRKGYV